MNETLLPSRLLLVHPEGSDHAAILRRKARSPWRIVAPWDGAVPRHKK